MIDYIEKEADQAIASYKSAISQSLSVEVVHTAKARVKAVLEQAEAQVAFAGGKFSALDESPSQRRNPPESIEDEAIDSAEIEAAAERADAMSSRANKVIERLLEALQ